jgi:hypothetical protein
MNVRRNIKHKHEYSYLKKMKQAASESLRGLDRDAPPRTWGSSGKVPFFRHSLVNRGSPLTPNWQIHPLMARKSATCQLDPGNDVAQAAIGRRVERERVGE